MRRGTAIYSYSSTLRRALPVVLLAGLLCLADASRSFAALPPGESIFPATTRFLVTCRSVKEFEAARSKTLFGKLAEDPLMKPFLEDLEVQIEQRIVEAEMKLGLKASDLKGMCDGQLSFGVVAYADDEAGKPQAGTLLLVDVTGHVPQAEQARVKLAASLAQNNGQQAPFQTPTGAAGNTYIVPPKKPEGRPLEFAEALHTQGETTVWLLGKPQLVTEISAKLAGAAGPTLAENDSFVSVMKQSAPAAGEPAAHVIGYLEPLALANALRAYEPANTRHKPDGLVVLKDAGFESIKGIGVQLTLGVGDYGMLARAAVLAPQPWQKSMNMLTFFPGADFAPQPWVAANVAGYATLYWDMLKAFDHFDPIFDGFLEQEGIWGEVKKSMKEDPDGPQIDIRQDFFALLGRRVTAILDNNLPEEADSPRYLVAFEIDIPAGTPEDQVPAEREKRLQKMRETMKKAFANDPSVEYMKVGDLDVYKIIAKEQVPANAPNQENVVNGERVIVSSMLAAAKGHVYFASHLDILQKVLGPVPAEGLATAADYVAVTAELGKFLPAEKPELLGLAFVRFDELMRVDYELFRAGKMIGSQTLLGRILDDVLMNREQPGPRPTKLSGAKLPPFVAIRKYLPPVGLLVRQTADGIQVIALTYEKAAPAEAK